MDSIRKTHEFVCTGGYLDNPQLVRLTEDSKRESLKKFLEDCGYENVEVDENDASADVSEIAFDSGFLWQDIREWFMEHFPFCNEFVYHEGWGGVDDLAEYIKDNRGDMTDAQVRDWIEQFPDKLHEVA